MASRRWVMAIRMGTIQMATHPHCTTPALAGGARERNVVETRYKPWGEVRFTTANETLPTQYTFTGQYSHMSDDATNLGAAGFGLLFYNARWYDPMAGRFAQADTIVPNDVQGFDRYSYTANNPVRYVDPSGHNWVECKKRSDYRCQIHANKIAESNQQGEAENLLDMLILAFLGYDTINLVGEALEKILSDPAFLEFRGKILKKIFGSPEYGETDFVFTFKGGVKFGGPRDPSSMLMQFLDPGNPEYSETQAVGSNELTWMLREATVSAEVRVTKEGKITISYSLTDVFDLKPQKGRSDEYNVVTAVLGSVWHRVLGASAPEVYANWTETFTMTVDINTSINWNLP